MKAFRRLNISFWAGNPFLEAHNVVVFDIDTNFKDILAIDKVNQNKESINIKVYLQILYLLEFRSINIQLLATIFLPFSIIYTHGLTNLMKYEAHSVIYWYSVVFFLIGYAA